MTLDKHYRVSMVRVTSRVGHQCCNDRYNRVQARVGDEDASVDHVYNKDNVMSINHACDGTKSFGEDGVYLFEHHCRPAIEGR